MQDGLNRWGRQVYDFAVQCGEPHRVAYLTARRAMWQEAAYETGDLAHELNEIRTAPSTTDALAEASA